MSKRENRIARQEDQKIKQRARFEAAAEFDIKPTRTPRIPELTNDDEDKVLWSFLHYDDYDWRKVRSDGHVGFCEVANKLRDYSGRTWKEIKADVGRDHPQGPATLSGEAQQRLADINREDVPELYRFRFAGTQRLWGFKDGAYFIALWWDPDHQVYIVEKKNT